MYFRTRVQIPAPPLLNFARWGPLSFPTSLRLARRSASREGGRSGPPSAATQSSRMRFIHSRLTHELGNSVQTRVEYWHNIGAARRASAETVLIVSARQHLCSEDPQRQLCSGVSASECSRPRQRNAIGPGPSSTTSLHRPFQTLRSTRLERLKRPRRQPPHAGRYGSGRLPFQRLLQRRRSRTSRKSLSRQPVPWNAECPQKKGA
jgi:hypothetical protein